MSVFTDEVVISNTPLPIDGGNTNAVKVDGSAVTQPVSGSVSVSNFPATQNVAVTSSVEVEVKNDSGSPIPVTGSVTTTPVVSSSSTVTQISSTGSNQTLLAANASRKKAILYFATGVWDVKLGASASPTSRTMRVTANNTFLEIDNVYQGQIDAACTSSGKLVDVTELI